MFIHPMLLLLVVLSSVVCLVDHNHSQALTASGAADTNTRKASVPRPQEAHRAVLQNYLMSQEVSKL